jgi:hypothetical protein
MLTKSISKTISLNLRKLVASSSTSKESSTDNCQGHIVVNLMIPAPVRLLRLRMFLRLYCSRPCIHND